MKTVYTSYKMPNGVGSPILVYVLEFLKLKGGFLVHSSPKQQFYYCKVEKNDILISTLTPTFPTPIPTHLTLCKRFSVLLTPLPDRRISGSSLYTTLDTYL